MVSTAPTCLTGTLKEFVTLIILVPKCYRYITKIYYYIF